MQDHLANNLPFCCSWWTKERSAYLCSVLLQRSGSHHLPSLQPSIWSLSSLHQSYHYIHHIECSVQSMHLFSTDIHPALHYDEWSTSLQIEFPVLWGVKMISLALFLPLMFLNMILSLLISSIRIAQGPGSAPVFARWLHHYHPQIALEFSGLIHIPEQVKCSHWWWTDKLNISTSASAFVAPNKMLVTTVASCSGWGTICQHYLV